MPAVLNAANEVAVDAFLKKKISFTDIIDKVEHVVSDMTCSANSHKLDDILTCDKEARERCMSLIY